MLRPLILAGVLSMTGMTAMAAELIRKDSPHSVAVTMDRLEAAVSGAGATIFARVNHSAGAAKVDMELADAETLIFGNPKLGTPAMQANLDAGLDLPMRVLVRATDNGNAQVVYRAPSALSDDHGVPGDAKVIKMMTGALDKLTGAAVAAE